MGWAETRTTVRRAVRRFSSAAQTGGRAGRGAARGTSRVVHRLTGASGAARTGLASLIELTGVGSAGDAFVTVALAGTLFFSASLDQARGRVALTLVVTMAPFAVLAPLIGPMLDRMQQGRRYLLAGTLLARGLLCWAMAGAVLHNDTVTLLPAAFGVLVLQKAYGVTRSAITPRLLPSEITLVTANARAGMASLIAATVAAPLAAGIDYAIGGGAGGAAWVLRLGTVVYLAATALSFRVPERVDTPEPQAASGQPGRPDSRATRPQPGYGGPGSTRPVHRAPTGTYQNGPARPGAGRQPPRPGTPPGAARPRPAAGGRPPGPQPAARANGGSRWRTLGRVGPIVGEAMRANATLRAFSGFMIFFLAFLLRIEHFPGVSDKVALGAMIAAAAAGGFLGTALGSALRARKPYLITLGMLATSTLITALCAAFFGLWAALVVSAVAALGQVLAKLALDSTVQQEIGEEIRSSTFAASETLHQLSWVVGGLAGIAMSFTASGVAGLTVAAVGLGLSLIVLVGRRRARMLSARRAHPQTAA
jgi:MFS family permease